MQITPDHDTSWVHNASLATEERLVQRKAEQTNWSFWQYQHPVTGEYHLYAWLPKTGMHQEAQALHLGVFADKGSLAAQQARFLEEPRTCVALVLDADELSAWLKAPATETAPAFIGQFGSHWSGYGLRPVEKHQVEVIYAADLRHEWLGVFTQAEAFAVIELDYDRRRRRCLIC